ncbi:MAG: carboxypeptidase regulatory-like domain-containing protein, partial [Candidatus Cloacimonetes bacterium]|nr:carboxypeptidase regulatory-like domain-containing protein [Candidatus Cloacimonadota bacterium]
WTPTTEGDVSIYGKVVLPLDSDATNDETPEINLNVFPAGQFAYTVGDGSSLERVPVDMYYKASLYQMLIYPAELSNFVGFINGLQFYNNFVTDLPDKPTKIWIETTTVEDLSAGWIPVTTNSTLVYDGVVNYPSGENTIPIIFPTPYMYLNPQNLLITIQRPLDGAYFSTNDKFRAQTIGTNRARKMQNDTTDYDPANPSSQGTLSGLIPRTTIIGIPGSVGHLSGTVTASGGAALEGVLVELVDAGYSATTDADGHYQIQYILPDTYSVSFSRYGYVTQTQTLVLEEEEEAVMNAVMQPMATVAVSGTVLASDTGAGLGGAVIQLTGYANYNAVSGGNGTFTIPAVYANQAYEYHIAAPGYVPETGTITVGSTAHQIDNIVLNEIAFAPHSVIAELSDDYSSIELEWEAPDPNAMEMLESFEDAQFPPVDWSQIITNTGPANSSGVYPTFTRLPTINAQNVIAPTHGMFQTGLWWTYEHQDEWLITPAFNCPPEGFMTFDSYVFLGSTNGDHYYVKVSTDGGNNWTPIWDASAETGGQITYNQPIFVDLSDYTSQQISLAFHAEDPPSNDGLWYTWFIDNIYIGNANTMVRFESPVITRSSRTTTSSTPAAEAITRGTQRNTIVGNTSRSVEIPQKRTERSLVGYYLYRLTTGQEANEASWDTLTDEPVSILSYTDDAWDDLQNGSYRWAVKAVYTAGVLSGPAFSNTMVKETVTGNLVGFIRRSNGTGIPGATIRTGTYSATTNTSGAYFLALPVGTYTITVTATGFTSQEITDVLISPNQNTTLNVVLTPTSNEDDVIPVTVTVLKGNSPNPFNPETNIAFDLAQAGPVSLEIFNIKGQRVRTLINKPMPAGRHRIVFDARDDRGKPLGSGVYLYRFRSGEYQSTRKMMLME